MQDEHPEQEPTGSSIGRKLGWFLVIPIIVALILSLGASLTIAQFQSQHANRIYTGITIWNTDLSMMSQAEARDALVQAFPYENEQVITLADLSTGEQWQFTPAELGLSFDIEKSVEEAYNIGRGESVVADFQQQFDAWYYGRQLAPTIVFNEGVLQNKLGEIAQELNQPAIDAILQFDGQTLSYLPGQSGRTVDLGDAQTRLTQPIADFRDAQIVLKVAPINPRIIDSPELTAQLDYILSPMSFYFQEPLADVDLNRVDVSSEQLAQWLRVELVENGNGTAHHEIFMDENAIRFWLAQFEREVFRQPENARFYFDDPTEELVLVERHVPGRELDVDATLDKFMEYITTPNRSVPFVVREILPTVHADATAAELGITELITQTTTWFYGSTPERKHNIATSAAQFFGLVVAPGEEFSFNRYLGDVSEEEGFTTGLVIVGGRTIEGVGGGVCQVSTTLYQAAFWSGFPITERLEHGYRVHYYDDGAGPGMDATVFTPIVDLKFVNNTPHHLLIENYYNAQTEALTFKLYSTSTGRYVEKEGPFYDNVTEPRPDVWEFNEDLEPGEIQQVDWAVEGSDVTVIRRVYDSNGNLMYGGQESFISRYIPWQNIYQYGPGADVPDGVDGG